MHRLTRAFAANPMLITKLACDWPFEPRHEIVCDQQRLRPACAYAQSDQRLCWSLEYSINFKLVTEQHLEFLGLTRVCRGSSESTLVRMPHCWKSHVMAHFLKM